MLYKRMVLERQLEELDKNIRMLEGAVQENENLRKDIDTETAIQARSEKKESKEVNQ